MRKVYEFHQLRKKAKDTAAHEVYNDRCYEDIDWTVESQMITEDITEWLKSEGLSVGRIYWDTNYGVNVDLRDVNMSDEFLKKQLTEEEYQLYLDLCDISSGYLMHKLYDRDYEREGYQMVFDYSSGGFDEKTGMEFIMKYSDDDELKAKYKFHLLLETSLSDEEEGDFTAELSNLGEELSEKLGDKIHGITSELYGKVEKSIGSQCDYLGSEEYYYDQLNEECSYVSEKYLFNYKGEIILKEGDFVDNKFEDIYHDAA